MGRSRRAQKGCCGQLVTVSDGSVDSYAKDMESGLNWRERDRGRGLHAAGESSTNNWANPRRQNAVLAASASVLGTWKRSPQGQQRPVESGRGEVCGVTG